MKRHRNKCNTRQTNIVLSSAFSLLLVILLACGCGRNGQTPSASAIEKIPESELAAQVLPQTAIPAPLPDRIVFVGDSRTVDMFTGSESEIPGGTRDGMTVFARDASNYTFLKEVLNYYKNGDYDMLISWMGANDRGDFSNYEELYESVLTAGKSLILCTVGPTDEASLQEFDKTNYTNAQMRQFNADLTSWAAAHSVPVIDLWSFISDPANGITVDTADGMHYLPRPTSAAWQYILSQLGK